MVCVLFDGIVLMSNKEGGRVLRKRGGEEGGLGGEKRMGRNEDERE